MKIEFGPVRQNANVLSKRQYPNLRPLAKDTVSFSSMKKSQFLGIDLMVLNKFKAPIEKFNSNDDFQKWCLDKLNDEIISKKENLCKSVDMQAQIQKQAILDEWINYATKENDAYSPAIQLMILSSITSDLNKDTNHLPPDLNKRILADTMSEIEKNCKENKNYTCNFNKLYRNKLRTGIIGGNHSLDENLSGWIVIPSKAKDPENFEDNVKKLQALSHDSWCTKTYNAEPYLAKGDFHVYLEEGQPKLGVRFNDDEIAEIQGEKNNTKIPVQYLDIAKKHVKENDFSISEDAEEEFKQAEEIRVIIERIKSDLAKKGADIKTCSTKQLLEALNIAFKENNEGKLILKEYHQPSEDYTFSDLGVDENRIFKDVVEIEENVNFENSNVTNLGNLQSIGGDADFRDSKVTDLGNLQSIGGRADFRDSNVTNLGNLQSIGGDADFRDSNITNLGNLQSIGGDARLGYSNITNLGNLQTIGGDTDFRDSKVTNLGNLQSIGGDADFEYSKVINLGNLQSIGGSADFTNAAISKIQKLLTIDKDLHIDEVGFLTNVKKVGGKIFIKNEMHESEIVEYIHKIKKMLGRKLDDYELKKIFEAGLTEKQIEVYKKVYKSCTRDGMDSTEAIDEAIFSAGFTPKK